MYSSSQKYATEHDFSKHAHNFDSIDALNCFSDNDLTVSIFTGNPTFLQIGQISIINL